MKTSMKFTTFLTILGLAVLTTFIPACSSTGSSSSSASISVGDVTTAINNIAATLSSAQTSQAVASTVGALQSAGAIDAQTAAEILLADTVISQVSSAVASLTTSDTGGKAAINPDRLRAARQAQFTKILTAHRAAIKPAKATKVLFR